MGPAVLRLKTSKAFGYVSIEGVDGIYSCLHCSPIVLPASDGFPNIL